MVTARFAADFSSFEAATVKAQTTLRSFETGAGKVEASLNKMVNSFSGTKIIQDATLMSQAFERLSHQGIGLTNSELQRMAVTAGAAADKLRAMGQDVPPGIQRIVDAAKNIHPALSMADRAAGLLKSTFAQFTLAGLATQAISKLGTELSQFIAVGAKLPAVEQSFKRLTGSMHIDSQTMLANMTTATRGMVSNYDLMLGANKAMLLGLPVTAASMGDLAKTAAVLGKAMGQDATASLNDLITALGRSSPMILDNLGLTVKVGEANEVYAAKIGKTVEQLTDAEKKMAFYEAAMEAARKKTAELGEQTRTLGDIATSVWTQIGNVVTTMSARVNVGIGAILSSQKNFVQYLKDFAAYGNAWDAVSLAAARAGKRIATDVNLPVEKTAEVVGKGTKAIKAHVTAIELVIAKTPEQLQVEALLAKAKAHEAAAVDFAAASWKAWEKTASQALKDVEKNSAPLQLITRDLSSFAPQIDAGSMGNLAGVDVVVDTITEKLGTKLKQGFTDAFSFSLYGFANDLSAAIAGDISLGKAFGNFATTVAKDFTATALSFIPGIGPMIAQFAGPIVDGVKKLFGSIFGIGSAGRDMVKEFAGTFGGFDALHVELNTLGAEGEKLWIALTQGVGRNNPKEAQAAIEAITKAFENQKAATAAAAQAVVENAAIQKAELDAISAKYDGIIGKLKGELGSFAASLQAEQDAPEYDESGTRIYGVLESQQMKRKAQLEEEIRQNEIARESELNEKQEMFDKMLEAGKTVDEELRTIFGKTLVIPYKYVPTNAPGGSVYNGSPAAPTGGDSAVHVYIGNAAVDQHVLRVVRTKTPGDLMVRGR